jgi:hypothetical protein
MKMQILLYAISMRDSRCVVVVTEFTQRRES